MSYFNCHSHTMYSNIRLLDCINRPKDLIDTAIKLGLKGIAITDHECVSAAIEVNQYAKKLRETNPDFTIAFGNEIYLGFTYYLNGEKLSEPKLEVIEDFEEIEDIYNKDKEIENI